MPNIENNITLVTARVNQAAIAAGRSPDEILLLAVSKTRSAEDIRSAINAGTKPALLRKTFAGLTALTA